MPQAAARTHSAAYRPCRGRPLLMESVDQLQAMSVAELIEKINSQAPNVYVGVQWYLDEYVRRQQAQREEATLAAVERQAALAEQTAEPIRQGSEQNERMARITAEMRDMTATIKWLTLFAVVASVLGVAISIVALAR